MRRGVVALGFAAFIVAAAAAAAAAAAGSKTVVTGTVLLDPATPVCRAGQPCTKPIPHFKLAFWRRGTIVARAVTDANGSYRVSLQPAVYGVTAPLHSRTGPGAGLTPKRIRIPATTRAKRDFRYDAGIR